MITIKNGLFLFILFSTVLPSYSKTEIILTDDDYSSNEISDWDSLVFTMQWPLTACLIWKDGKPMHTCSLPKHHRWTVHGIWPNSKDGSQGPFFCNSTWVFDPNGVKPIRQDLLREWPNVHGNDTEDSLWKHEWEKHGTCAALDEHFSSEMLYFNQGIQWANKYQLSDYLSKSNIIPSLISQYNASVISQIIANEIGAIPMIGCESDRETGLTYLAEIRICFHRDLTLIDCKHHSHRKQLPPLQSVGDCPTHKLIFYPSDASRESVLWLKRKHSQKRKLDKQVRLRNKFHV